ncbi:MAG TPA: DUF2017 domain-containing protein [Cellulomonadaceae bacterium]|nr:DUF2017 domain-containing protein [Cellulomonadaceae bacterium]
MRPFAAVAQGYRAVLDPVERQVIASIVAEVVELLGAELDTAPPGPEETGLLARALAPERASVPDDPAVRRLLPDASRDDPEVSEEFRRLTEGDLRDTKVRRLVAFWRLLQAGGGTRGDRLELARDDASDLAATLTDVRLVLADRLGLSDDEQVEALYTELEGDEPDRSTDPEAVEDAQRRRFLGSVYTLLTYLQESLLTAMLRDLPRDRPRDLPGVGG